MKTAGLPLHACWIALVCGAGKALASEEPLPDFAECMAAEIARYEQALQVFAPSAAQSAGFPLAEVGGVEFCGTVGIVICDRSDNPLGCQRALAVEQDILRARVLDQLPAPIEDDAANSFAQQLYGTTWALAHGMSAGQDCAGTEPRLEMWCRAREANGRLRAAVMAWRVARNMGAVPPAVEAGWIAEARPTRPRLRPGESE
ncbi:hypothetical protein [Roseovarius rhodophyticola]|uniref:Lysozyme inhibitor LprI N-terminal domain-containing protein n=1 Tax=Roseovarius rhodophyticola TaxID=3080827 RepID=A0ABZ2TD82_9RHOB|nr:hypothetical protein [Roseovarius sp. W115]MDV2931427.1 hypothetical protein [Roseovarius sp. W115]